MKKSHILTILAIIIVAFSFVQLVDWMFFVSNERLQNEGFIKVRNDYFSRYPFGVGQFFEENVRLISFFEIPLLFLSSLFLFTRTSFKVIFIIIGIVGILTALFNVWSLL